MSARASAGSPSSCSGDMYWNVPITVPCSVIGRSLSSIVSSEDMPLIAPEPPVLARPKSTSLAPALVIITLPGLRSRCTMPRRCAASSPEAIWAPQRSTSSSDSGPCSIRSASDSPSIISITR